MKGILKLSQQFNTSLTSTAIRYVKSADFFCVVVKWNPDGFGWRWISQEAFQDRYIRTIRQLESLPHDSATRIAMARQAQEKDFEERGATSAMWFDFIRTGGSRDAVLIEQAVALGPHGFLTVLIHDN